MGYRRDLWEVAATHHGVVTVASADDAGVPAVELRKLASRGALQSHGQGVYTHRDIPATPFTQPAIAVALAGAGAFLERESVLDLFDLGQFNPRKIRVGTRRRVRRALPEWMELDYRPDVIDSDLEMHEGILSTTVRRALIDMERRIPPDRWADVRDQARERGLLNDFDNVLKEQGVA
ncbi:type IV toxin-antitoxin system AbiEi family antitoxin domain-containing protein [Leucobacter sp. HY1910]